MPKYTMQDQRAFTDYRPSCDLNRMLQEKFKVNNSHEYRYYLQKNAEEIMKNFTESSGKEECEFCPICKKSLDYKPTGDINKQM
jgi:hypothetical protein